MCNRFSFIAKKEEVEEYFNFQLEGTLKNSYNIAATDFAYVITNENPEKIQYFTWGLVPATSNDGINKGRLIQARRESVSSQPSFRMPIRNRRCLVLADSYYEWKQVGLKKYPYRIKLKRGTFMVFAGLWDIWASGNSRVKSFSIITTPSNLEVSEVYARMPVLLSSIEEQKKWISNIDLYTANSLLKTPADNIFDIFRVTEKINSFSYKGADLHTEVPEIK